MEEKPGRIQRILLVINLHKKHTLSLSKVIEEGLLKKGLDVVSFAFDGKQDTAIEGPFDLAISLGGDGTVLYTARLVAGWGVPIMAINLGNLGFIAEVHPEEWLKTYISWEEGKVEISERLMLEFSVERGGNEIFAAVCMNEVVISASGIAKIIRLKVEGECIQLGQYRSDGLIVATPTGSTAYSVAAGGPILDPEMEAVIINPICPFTLSNRPLVVPIYEPIVVRIEEEQRSKIVLTVDGQLVENLEPGDIVRLHKAPYKARLIATNRKNFYDVLCSKLNWPGAGFGGPGFSGP